MDPDHLENGQFNPLQSESEELVTKPVEQFKYDADALDSIGASG